MLEGCRQSGKECFQCTSRRYNASTSPKTCVDDRWYGLSSLKSKIVSTSCARSHSAAKNSAEWESCASSDTGYAIQDPGEICPAKGVERLSAGGRLIPGLDIRIGLEKARSTLLQPSVSGLLYWGVVYEDKATIVCSRCNNVEPPCQMSSSPPYPEV